MGLIDRLVHRASGPPWRTLPQNLLNGPMVLIDGFEDVALWPAITGSRAANTTAGQFVGGTQSIKATASSGGDARLRLTLAGLDLSKMGRIDLWTYLHDPTADYGAGAFKVKIMSPASMVSSNYSSTYGPLMQGRASRFHLPKSFFAVAAGNLNWAAVRVIEVFWTASAAGKTPSLSWDRLEWGPTSVPALLLSFDDGWVGVYQNAFPVMRARGIRGTCFIVTSLVGTAGYMTWAQIAELAANGWTIANHTQHHTDLSGLTEAQQETEIQAGITDLTAQGYGASAKYFAYPFGGHNANTMTAMSNLGMLYGRTTLSPISDRRCMMPFNDVYRGEAVQVGNTVSVAQAKGYIDSAITDGAVLPMFFHNLGIAGTEMTTADFAAVLDYWSARRSQMPAITYDDFYRLQFGPVTVPA